MPDQVYCVLDFETYSETDLKRVGAFEYSVHPSTEVLCVAWRIGTRKTLRDAETKAWAPGSGSGIIELLNALERHDIQLVAHNAYFEQVITRNTLGRMLHTQGYLKSIPVERWVCTAALAAALALPRDLEGAAKALKLPVQKDMDGRRLILKWCKPRKATKHDAGTRHDDPEELKRLIQYCKTDVDTEVELFLTVPPLTLLERHVWILDQRINHRGFYVDRQLVKTVLAMIAEESINLLERTRVLTGGKLRSTSQRAQVLKWLELEGLTLPDLRKKTVEDALADGLAVGRAKAMLEIRLASAKTSTAKYEAFELRSRHDSRLRDILKYHTASTGRWGGAGVQPQNFPRGNIKDTVRAASVLADGDLELVRLIYGEPMSVFSSCLRSMIVAPKGYVLDVADYASIEARVLFWVAKHEKGLEAFRANRPIYEEMAADIYQVKTPEVSPSQRFLGKQSILGCGYGMGWPKFQKTCLMLGQEVSDALAEMAVRTYRSKHAPVVALWGNLERAARYAIENPGKKYTINYTTWFVKNKFLWCELPSGRRLAYREPEVVFEATTWGKRPVVYHWGVDSISKKWTRQKTYGGKLCIARGTLVLAKQGWVPIQDIKFGDFIWDGVNWVQTDGAVYKGRKKTIYAFGAWMTADHQVLTTSGWVVASQSERYIRAQCRIPSGYEILGEQREKIVMGRRVHLQKRSDLTRNRVKENEATGRHRILRVQAQRNHLPAQDDAWNVEAPCVRGLEKYARPVQASNPSSMEELWRQGHKSLQKMAELFSEFLGRYGRGVYSWAFNRPDRQQPRVLKDQLPLGDKQNTSEQPSEEVYDLLNCGPLARFVIATNDGPLIVHNCENVVQAISRDIMAEAMLRIEASGVWDIVLSVHDELIGDRLDDVGDIARFCRLMEELPVWATGLPVKAEGWSGYRYRK